MSKLINRTMILDPQQQPLACPQLCSNTTGIEHSPSRNGSELGDPREGSCDSETSHNIIGKWSQLNEDEDSQTTTLTSDDGSALSLASEIETSTFTVNGRGLSLASEIEQFTENEAGVVEEVKGVEDAKCSEARNQTYSSQTHSMVDNNGVRKSILKTTDTAAKPTKRVSEVSFDTVKVRYYSMELGDHPSCSIGPPVCLSWDFTEGEPRRIDAYESARRFRRRRRSTLLNYYQRMDILKEAGFTDEEIRMADQERKKIQRQRSGTRMLLPFRKLEEVWESTKRKTKRLVYRGGKGRSQSAEAQEDISVSHGAKQKRRSQ